jgi:hypothetical protein
MNIKQLDDDINNLLRDFEVKNLPNLPNIGGVFEQSDITFAIVSGAIVDVNIIKIRINISISATFRKDFSTPKSKYSSGEQSTLYGLLQAVIFKLQKQRVTNGGFLELVSFENFTPDSGKWRNLISFDVDIPIESEKDSNNCLTLLGVI